MYARLHRLTENAGLHAFGAADDVRLSALEQLSQSTRTLLLRGLSR